MPRGNVRVSIDSDTRGLQRGVHNAETTLGRFSKSTGSHFGNMVKSGAGLATGFLGVQAAVSGAEGAISSTIRASSEAEVSQRKLQAQLKASNLSYRAHAKEIDNVIQRVSKLSGLDDEDLQDAFTNIIRVTGDVNKSLKLTGLAADFARAKHIDVAKAGEIVGKVAGGNIGILSRYGIQIKKGADASEALGILQQKFAGQAKAYGQTQQGAMDRAGVAVENLQEKLGNKLAPTITRGANAVAKFVNEIDSGTGAGGRFAEKVSEIVADAKPVVTQFAHAAHAVGEFLSHNPELVKAGLYVGGIGLALKTLKFASAKTGFTDLVKMAASAGKGIVKILRGSGQRAGEAAAANAAEALADNAPKRFSAQSARFRGAGKIVGVSIAAGALIGVAGIGTELGRKIVSELQDYIRGSNLPGPLKKLSDLGSFIGKNLPGPQQIFFKKKAMGGRIDGAPVAADTVPAMLSPREFVVTGGGEQILERMTFPGVLNWLEGVQPAHFAGGGRPRPLIGGAFVTGYEAGLGGQRTGLLGDILGKFPAARAATVSGGGMTRAPSPTGTTSGTLAQAGRVASMFGLHITSGYRSPSHNAAVGGVPGSLHTHGSPSNPGAVDEVGPVANMYRALAWSKSHLRLKEAMVHNVGSGLHLHLGFFRKGGRVGQILSQLRGASGSKAKALLRTLSKLAGGLSLDSLLAAIGKASHGKSTTGVRGALSLLQGEFGRQIGETIAGIDAQEDTFSQADTDLLNKLKVSGVDAESEQSLAVQRLAATKRITQLKRNRTTIAARLKKARKSGSKKLVKTLTARLSAADSALLAGRADLVDLAPAAEAPPTAADFANSDLALAQLTPGSEDDLAALGKLEGIRQGDLTSALASGDPRLITEAAGSLKDVRDSIEGLKQSMDNTNELLQQQLDLQKQTTLDLQRKLNVSEGQFGVFKAWFADVVSGHVGGRVGLGFQSAGVAGQVARY